MIHIAVDSDQLTTFTHDNASDSVHVIIHCQSNRDKKCTSRQFMKLDCCHEGPLLLFSPPFVVPMY